MKGKFLMAVCIVMIAVAFFSGHFRKKWTKAKKGTMVNNLL